MFRPLALAACLPALSVVPTLSAQSGLSVDTRIRPWPSSETGGDFGRFLHGDVSGLPGQEAVGLRGGRLYVVADPSAYDGLERVDTSLSGAADLAVIPGGGPEIHDSILTVDPVQGLKHHVIDLATGEFTSTVLDSSWTSVTHLTVGDLDGDGVENDIVGGDGMVMLPLIHNGTSYVAGSAHINATPIIDLEVLDYDADGSPDIAMLTEGGLAVIEYGGPAFPFSAAPLPGGTITVLPRANVGGDELIWVTQIGSTWYLFVQDAFGRSAPLALQFVPGPGQPAVDIDFVDVSAAQLSIDNTLDLLISQKTLTEAIVLLNTGTANAAAFSTGAGDVESYNITIGSMATNGAAAVAAVGGGGEAWMYYPLDSNDSVFVAQVVPYDGDPVLNLQSGMDFKFINKIDDPLGTHVLVEFNNPSFDTTVYNAVQIFTFHHCEVADPVEPDGLNNLVFFVDPADDDEGRYRARLPLPDGICDDDGIGTGPTIWDFGFRVVEATNLGGGSVSIDSHDRLDTFAIRYSVDQVDRDELATLPTWQQTFKVVEESSTAAPSPGATPGDVVLLDELPIFGGPPRPGTPTVGPQLTPVLP